MLFHATTGVPKTFFEVWQLWALLDALDTF